MCVWGRRGKGGGKGRGRGRGKGGSKGRGTGRVRGGDNNDTQEHKEYLAGAPRGDRAPAVTKTTPA